jgi:hypothetical protein
MPALFSDDPVEIITFEGFSRYSAFSKPSGVLAALLFFKVCGLRDESIADYFADIAVGATHLGVLRGAPTPASGTEDNRQCPRF